METCGFVDWISLLISMPLIGLVWLMAIGATMVGWRFIRAEFLDD